MGWDVFKKKGLEKPWGNEEIFIQVGTLLRALLPRRARQSHNPACVVQQQTLGPLQAPGSATVVDLDPPVTLTNFQFLLLPV